MRTLTPRQQQVFTLRFGQALRVATPEEVARTLGVSSATVRRIEREALRRLRLDAADSIGSRQCDWDEA